MCVYVRVHVCMCKYVPTCDYMYFECVYIRTCVCIRMCVGIYLLITNCNNRLQEIKS